MIELVGVSEIAKLLHVSRQRVHQLARRPDFPQPVADNLQCGLIWLRSDIAQYATDRNSARGR